MYRNILLATDGSELADRAVEQGLELAKQLGAKATIVTVTDMIPTGYYGAIPTQEMIDRYEEASSKHAHNVLSRIARRAEDMGLECASRHVKDQQAAEGILETAKADHCDLIVMASHGRRGLAKYLLGSEAQKVVTLSEVPVLICR